MNRLLLVPLVVLLAACAALPAGKGVPEVQRLLDERALKAPATGTTGQEVALAPLLAQPLDVSAAVQLALLNNPAVRAEYARLGLAAAEIYEAGRLSNPRFSAQILVSSSAADADQVTFGVSQRFTELILLPVRRRLAQGEFERAQLSAGRAIFELATEVESGWYRVVGAQQIAALRERQTRVAVAAADLAQRLFDAGNVSARELAETRAAASAARLLDTDARAEVAASRTAFAALLGLAPAQPWTVAAELTLPTGKRFDSAALQRTALEARLDVQAARRELALLEDMRAAARRYRYLGELEVGVSTERGTDRVRISGPQLSLELPVFNRGDGRIARAEAQLALARSELQALETRTGAEVDEACNRLRLQLERLTLLREQLIPQRETALARTQEEVNFMLEGPFTLLRARALADEARQQAAEAERDYWLAWAALTRAVGRPLTGLSGVTDAPTVAPPPAGSQKNPPAQDAPATPRAGHAHHHEVPPASDTGAPAHAGHGTTP